MSGAVSPCFIAATEIYRNQETRFLDPVYFTLWATSADYSFFVIGGESLETWEIIAMVGCLLAGICLIVILELGGFDE